MSSLFFLGKNVWIDGNQVIFTYEVTIKKIFFVSFRLCCSDIDLVILGVSSDKKSFLLLESCLKSSNLTSYLEAVLNARV